MFNFVYMVNCFKILTLVVLFSFSNLLIGQDIFFEGKIQYKIKSIDKIGNNTTDSLLGTKLDYFVRKNKFKHVFQGQQGIEVIYPGNDTIYIISKRLNKVFFQDVKSFSQKVISYEIKKNVIEVNGVVCDLLFVITNKGKQYYYFNESYKVNKNYFGNHNYELWSFMLEKTNGSIALKSIMDFKDKYFEMTAVLIEEKTLQDSIFSIPSLPLISN